MKTYKILNKKGEETSIVWNWECIRDFCPMYANWSTRNEGLMYYLPKAVDVYCKSNGQDYKEVTKYVINDFEDSDEYDMLMTDYRTGIDTRQVILKALITGQKPTEQELAAILDVIYIDNITVDVEMIANKLMKGADIIFGTKFD